MTQVFNDLLELEKMNKLAVERLEDWHSATEEEHEEFGTLIGGCIVIAGGWENIDELVGEISYGLNYKQLKKELDYDMFGSHIIKYQGMYYFVEEQ